MTGKHVNFYVYVNSIQSLPSQSGSYVATSEIIPLFYRVVLRKNDTVQFYVENIDDDTDILVSDAYAELS